MLHPHHTFASPIEYLLSQAHDADIRATARRTGIEDGGGAGEDVARPDRTLPLQRVDTRRAEGARIEEQPVAEHAHEDGADMPARGDQAAELFGRRRTLVDMPGQRIELL